MSVSMLQLLDLGVCDPKCEVLAARGDAALHDFVIWPVPPSSDKFFIRRCS